MRAFYSFLFIFYFFCNTGFAQHNSKTIAESLKQLSESESPIDSLAAINRFTSGCRALSAQLDCVKSAIKGLTEDGLGGDIDTVKGIAKVAYAGAKFSIKEATRAQLSIDPAGRLLLKSLGKKTIDEKISEKIEKLGPLAKEALPILKRLAFDGDFLNQKANELQSLLTAFVAKAATEAGAGLSGAVEGANKLDCQTIQSGICRIAGQFGYEALATAVITAGTIEAGGAGGFAKLASLLPKLAKQYPKLEPFIKLLYKLGDDLAAVAKKIKPLEKAGEEINATAKLTPPALPPPLPHTPPALPTPLPFEALSGPEQMKELKKLYGTPIDAETVLKLTKNHKHARAVIAEAYTLNPALKAEVEAATAKKRAEIFARDEAKNPKTRNLTRISNSSGVPPGYFSVSSQFKVLKGEPPKEFRVAVQEVYDVKGRLAGHEVLEIRPDGTLMGSNLTRYKDLPVNKNINKEAAHELELASEKFKTAHGLKINCSSCHAFGRIVDTVKKGNRSPGDGSFINTNLFMNIAKEVKIP